MGEESLDPIAMLSAASLCEGMQPVEKGFYLISPQAMRAPPPPKGAGWSE